MSTINQEIILKGGSFIRREVTETPLGTQEEILRKYTRSMGTTLPAIRKNSEGRLISLHVTQDSICVMAELNSLPFKCPFRPYEIPFGDRVPSEFIGSVVFAPFPRPHEQQLGDVIFENPFIWPKATMGRLFFIADIEPSTLRPNNCYLIAFDDAGEIIVPPMFNIYEDGRVCMGNEWTTNRRGGAGDVLGIFDYCLSTFMRTPISNDLSGVHVSTFFARSLETTEWLAPSYTSDQMYRMRNTTSLANLSGINYRALLNLPAPPL